MAAFIIVSLTLAALTAREGLLNLYTRWAGESEYGYGFLAAAIVLLILWTRRNVILALSTSNRWPGLGLVIVGQMCAMVGALGESYFIDQIAFVLTLLGLAVVILGTGPIRIFIPLVLIMLLTIPLPYTLQAILTVKLQLISTNVGVAAIRLFGIPVFVDGNVIDLGQYKLQVAEACSGLRYLLPLTCISLIIAYLYQAPLWKRAIVVASAPPITILINSFRIAVTAVLVDNYGPQMADGFLHQFEGWIIFLIGALLLAVEILALERFSLAKVDVESIFGTAMAPSRVAKPNSLSGSTIAAGFVCAAVFVVVSSLTWSFEVAAIITRDSFVAFPQKLDEWSGHEGKLDPAITDALKATDYYIGDFTEATNGPAINLFVVYYESLSKHAAIHSPRVCLPGDGWEFALFEEKDYRELAPGTVGTFNRVIVQKGEQRILMYYWFQQRTRRTANEFSMKYYLLVDSLKDRRKDGGLVRIYTPILAAGERGVYEADGRLHAFAKVAIPKMIGYLPE